MASALVTVTVFLVKMSFILAILAPFLRQLVLADDTCCDDEDDCKKGETCKYI